MQTAMTDKPANQFLVTSYDPFLKAAGVVVLLIWFASLFARLNFGPSGFEVLKWGWAGPAVGFMIATRHADGIIPCFAWYSNILLGLCITKMLRGKHPELPLATSAFALALSSFGPIYSYSGATTISNNAEYVRGTALWLWLLSFEIMWCTAFFRRKNTI